jgi:hypothetical protein
MDDVMNGQIVPALGQWQGTMLIVATLGVASLQRWLRRIRKSV